MKRLFASILLIAFSGVCYSAQAQFEGQVNYLISNPQDVSQGMTSLNMTFFGERIFIESSTSVNVMSGIDTNGILVRNDYQDFVFMTGPCRWSVRFP